jgi:hypothetical protein
MTEPTSLMATVLKAKYFPNDHFLKAKQGYIPSYVWQCISRASWVLKKGCIWLVGNGNNINIWEDRWIHQQVGTKIWTPKPNNTSLHLVKDLIKPHSNEWNEDIIKQNFFPIEAELICQIPTINSEGEDLISWQGTKEGNYTVRSGYNAIMEWHQADSNQAKHTSSKDDPINWNNIWKVVNPPKQIHLMWRILNNALPVKSNLILRGMVCDSLCPRCHNGPETIDHVFLNCDQARQVWFSSPLTITTSSSKFQSYRDWFNYMLTNTTKDCIQIIVTITYSLWLARNKKIFQNRDIPASETVEKAIKVLQEYKHNSNPAQITSTRIHPSADCNNSSWSPPPRASLKLNVDAHLFSDGRLGLGLVLRDEDGRIVGAATKVQLGSGNVQLSETLGLVEALKMIDSLKLRSVIIEMDAATIVRAIHNKSYHRN